MPILHTISLIFRSNPAHFSYLWHFWSPIWLRTTCCSYQATWASIPDIFPCQILPNKTYMHVVQSKVTVIIIYDDALFSLTMHHHIKEQSTCIIMLLHAQSFSFKATVAVLNYVTPWPTEQNYSPTSSFIKVIILVFSREKLTCWHVWDFFLTSGIVRTIRSSSTMHLFPCSVKTTSGPLWCCSDAGG